MKSESLEDVKNGFMQKTSFVGHFYLFMEPLPQSVLDVLLNRLHST